MECTCLDQVCPVGGVIEGFNRARSIQEQALEVDYWNQTLWLKYSEFEMKNKFINHAMNVWDHVVTLLAIFERFFQCHSKVGAWIQFAKYIYKFSLDHIPKGRAEDLYEKFEGIEEVIVGKRWFQYEDEMKKSTPNYDTWFDYIRFEESMGTKERIRKVFERAIANVSPAEEKWYWQCYIYLW
ncbi:hypothetical protein UlMin_010122 [Ulmus minor]